MTDIDSTLASWDMSGKIYYTGRLNHRYETIDLKAAAERARRLTEQRAPNSDGWAVPLHQEDEPELSSKYVIWRPDDATIGWRNRGKSLTGAEEFTPVSDLEDTEIAHRMRFWIPEDRLTAEEVDYDLPPETISPTSNLDHGEKSEFFDELLRFVREERQTELESSWEEFRNLNTSDAKRRGHLAGPFVPLGEGTWKFNAQGFRYQFAEENNRTEEDLNLRDEYGIFRDNIVAVHSDLDSDLFPFQAHVEGLYGPNVVLQPDWNQIDNREIAENHLNKAGPDIWLYPLQNPVPYDRRKDAIEQVKNDRQKRELITGNTGLKFESVGLPESGVELNPYQQKAMTWAYRAKDVAFIHGPPGTGKTRTLTEYIRRSAGVGQSVLITAHSNQAVDNLIAGDSTVEDPESGTLHKLAHDEEEISIARAGSNTENEVVARFYLDESIERADIVAATTNGAAQFDQNQFDVAIIDEATQASRPSTAIVMNCSPKLVLAGDHKQLPPYSADETMREEELHISLFEYLVDRYDSKPSVFLQKQYRMNHQIAEFPNQAFYQNQLETASENFDWTVDDLHPFMGVDIDGEERREDSGNSMYNLAEAEAAAKQVELLVRNGLAPSDIGVIPAYRGQVQSIKSAIHQIDIEDPDNVTVDTIDSFQGGEREAIIISFVRSNEQGNSGFLEFPEVGPRRLNVALTRARKRLVVIGNWNTLGTVSPHRSPESSCANLYAELEEHIRERDLMLSPN